MQTKIRKTRARRWQMEVKMRRGTWDRFGLVEIRDSSESGDIEAFRLLKTAIDRIEPYFGYDDGVVSCSGQQGEDAPANKEKTR